MLSQSQKTNLHAKWLKSVSCLIMLFHIKLASQRDFRSYTGGENTGGKQNTFGKKGFTKILY